VEIRAGLSSSSQVFAKNTPQTGWSAHLRAFGPRRAQPCGLRPSFVPSLLLACLQRPRLETRAANLWPPGGSYSLVSRAVLSLVLLLAAVPAASASRTGGEISHCRTFGVIPPTHRSAQPRDLDLKVSYSLETSVTGGQVRWTLSLRNRTSSALRLSFPTSQYANVILRQGGKIVYSWSSDRVFAQVVTSRLLGARATYVCSLGPDLFDLEPGSYEVTAYLASRSVPVRTRRSLVIPGQRPFMP
jgi:Intracellular proteinase inhibitor